MRSNSRALASPPVTPFSAGSKPFSPAAPEHQQPSILGRFFGSLTRYFQAPPSFNPLPSETRLHAFFTRVAFNISITLIEKISLTIKIAFVNMKKLTNSFSIRIRGLIA
jgi:hypothetical protein